MNQEDSTNNTYDLDIHSIVNTSTTSNCLSIHLPIHTKSIPIALKHLGGYQEVQQQVNQNPNVFEFNLSTYPYTSPIYPIKSEKQEFGGILLRLKRKKKRNTNTLINNEEDEIYYDEKVEVIGIINETYSFKKPFDFQVSFFD